MSKLTLGQRTLNWLVKKGGSMTMGEYTTRSYSYGTPKQRQRNLEQLAKAGEIVISQGPKKGGGFPATIITLNSKPAVTVSEQPAAVQPTAVEYRQEQFIQDITEFAQRYIANSTTSWRRQVEQLQRENAELRKRLVNAKHVMAEFTTAHSKMQAMAEQINADKQLVSK